MRTAATAFAPATSANVAVGFDILGFAITGLGDRISIERRQDSAIIIQDITGHPDAARLPRQTADNTAGQVILSMQTELSLNFGVDIRIEKGIPLGSGLGGSAASAVAAAVAMNALLPEPLSTDALINFALCGEQVASGQKHGDNVIPCLLGGLQLTTQLTPLNTIALPIPAIHAVFVHPHLVIETKAARQCLEQPFALADVVQQTANLAGFISSLYTGDMAQFTRHIQDVLVTPRRAQLIPGFDTAQQAALEAGALAANISGAGPTLFAFAPDTETATEAGQAMQQAFAQHQLDSDVWLSPIAEQGAYVIPEST